MKSREKLVEDLNAAELFLRNRANALPASLNEYDIEALKDISQLICKAISILERAIVPPCKVGDTVYIIYPKQGIVERKVKRFQFGKYGLLAMVYGEGMNVDQLGTHFFLTKEEAEKELAKEGE